MQQRQCSSRPRYVACTSSITSCAQRGHAKTKNYRAMDIKSIRTTTTWTTEHGSDTRCTTPQPIVRLSEQQQKSHTNETGNHQRDNQRTGRGGLKLVGSDFVNGVSLLYTHPLPLLPPAQQPRRDLEPITNPEPRSYPAQSISIIIVVLSPSGDGILCCSGLDKTGVRYAYVHSRRSSSR